MTAPLERQAASVAEQVLQRTRGLDPAARRAAEEPARAVARGVLELLAEVARADPVVAAALREMEG